MADQRLQKLAWLPELVAKVRSEFVRLSETERQQAPALKAEYDALARSKKGWAESLANPDLPGPLRVEIEEEWAKAVERMQEIENLLSEDACRRQAGQDLIDPELILERFENLSRVLATHNPTLGNLELSLHIDKIVCEPDGKVIMRTCKLGALTNAVELFANNENLCSAATERNDGSPGKRQVNRRRRGRLRVADVDDGNVDMRAVADFAADPNRFAGLGDEWFWEDTFHVPEPTSWAKDHAEDVKRRYDEIHRETGKKPSQSALAREFGKSRPTIKAALDIANGKVVPKKRGKPGKHTSPIPKETREEIVSLHRKEKKQTKEISEITGVHRNTVSRILDEWYEQRGEKRPDGRRWRWNRGKK